MLILGVALMGIALLWPKIATSALVYDEQQAVEHQRAVAELHGLHDERPHNGEPLPSDVQARRDLVQERLNRSRAELVRARRIREEGGAVLRFIGVVLALAGLGVLFYQTA